MRNNSITSNKAIDMTLSLSELHPVMICHIYFGCILCSFVCCGSESSHAMSEHGLLDARSQIIVEDCSQEQSRILLIIVPHLAQNPVATARLMKARSTHQLNQLQLVN